MNPDYMIFVFPRPWSWLSLVCFMIVTALYARILWERRKARRALIEFGEGLADLAARAGRPELVEKFEGELAKLRRKPWRAERETAASHEEAR